MSVNILNDHSKIHLSKRFECSECDENFSSNVELNFHLKNHSEVTAIDSSYATITSSPLSKWSTNISYSRPTVLKFTTLRKRCISTSPEGKPCLKQKAL